MNRIRLAWWLRTLMREEHLGDGLCNAIWRVKRPWYINPTRYMGERHYMKVWLRQAVPPKYPNGYSWPIGLTNVRQDWCMHELAEVKSGPWVVKQPLWEPMVMR
jgi:hypothetical protein